MLHLAVIFSLLALSTANLKYSDCGGTAARIKSFAATPYPIKAKTGVEHSISFDAVVSKPIGEATLKLSISKYVGFMYVKIPCIGGVGSCNYEGGCAKINKAINGVKKCIPLPSGNYKKSFNFKIPSIPSAASMLTSGYFKGKVSLVDPRSSEVYACVTFETKVTN